MKGFLWGRNSFCNWQEKAKTSKVFILWAFKILRYNLYTRRRRHLNCWVWGILSVTHTHPILASPKELWNISVTLESSLPSQSTRRQPAYDFPLCLCCPWASCTWSDTIYTLLYLASFWQNLYINTGDIYNIIKVMKIYV